MDGTDNQSATQELQENDKAADSQAMKELAEPDYLNSDEEEELNSFANEFINLLKAETIKSRRKKPKDSIAKESIQVYSLAVAILSEELLSQLPGVINFTLRNFSTSKKVAYRKVGNYRIFLGSVDQLKKVESKLLELTEQNKVNIKIEKESTTQSNPGQEVKKPGRKKRVRTWDDGLLEQPITNTAPLAHEGRRISSRLCSKPRKSYASLHTVGQSDDGVYVKVELDVDADPAVDPDYIPNKRLRNPEQHVTDNEHETMHDAVTGRENNKQSAADEIPATSSDANKDKLQPPKRRGPGRPQKRGEKTEPGNCDICFLKFPSRRLLEYHRNKHFDGEGHLTEPALALHIQGLSKHNLDENLTDVLAEQVKAYRETLKSGSKITHNGEDSFIINEIRVEGVEDKPSAADLERVDTANGELDTTTSSATNPTPPGCHVATAPKKKRGRKSNFEKGLPFMVRGKVVSGHLSMEADQKLTSESKAEPESYQCDICHNRMVSLQSLKVHVQNVHVKRGKRAADKCRRIQQEELRCPHCSFVCYRTQNFTRHLKTHNNPDLYMCDRCDYTHKLRAEVLRHKRNAHAERNFKCEHCGSLHRNQSLLNMHVKLKHTLAYSMVCDVCGKRCNTKAAYREHMARHRDVHGPPVGGQVMCTLCARVLPSRNSFEQHRLKFHGEDFEAEETRKMNEGVVIFNSGTFQCKYCQSYTNSIAREVRRHILRMHMPRKYQCDQCKAAFPLEKLLLKHVRIVHYGLEKKKCPECNKWFRNNAYLTQHVKRVHSAEFQCNICKKLLSDKRTLQDHYEIHKAPQDRAYRFTCEICGKRFRFQSNYDYHMMEHTGSRPFACSICSRQFRTKHVLERHLSTHSDERPFACDRCHKCFKLKKYLDAHQLTHSGSRYVCNLCCKPFSSKESLSRHTCKSYVVQPDAGQTTTSDDRIVQVQISVESEDPGDQMVHYYVCASCREGYVDVDEAIGHVCRTDDEGDISRASDELPSQYDATAVSDSMVIGCDSEQRQHQVDVVKAGGTVGQFAVIADGVSAVSLTSTTTAAPQAGILDSESLLESGPLDDAGLLPSQQFVLLEQEAAVLTEGEGLQQQQESEEEVLQTGQEELPVEMYMCGLCNLLFNSQTDIQQHLQVHASALTTTSDGDLAGTNDQIDAHGLERANDQIDAHGLERANDQIDAHGLEQANDQIDAHGLERANDQIDAHGLERANDQIDASQLAVTDGDAQLLLADNIQPIREDVAMDTCHDDVTNSVTVAAAMTMVLEDRSEDGSQTELVPMD